MGIDIYARWRGQSNAEVEAQMNGFSVLHGHVGYLREAYHGEPYATEYLVQEAFEHPDHAVQIPAAVLRERLPHTLTLAEERQRTIYEETDEDAIAEVAQSFTDFVDLCERKEQETHEPITIIVSF